MSSTAGLVKTTLDYKASGVVKYNMKESKTKGQWQDQDQQLSQKDLIDFYGTVDHPDMTLHQQGNLLINQANNNARMSDAYSTSQHHLLYGDNAKKSICHTVVQSFDYKDNPNLTPKQVHTMGIEMIHGIHNYLWQRYHYNLDSGMISTHIDRNKTGFSQKDQMNHTKHLHNHIVIPSYNQQGQSISPYLRKQDIYAFQRINDEVCVANGLKDYHFLKLNRQIQPSSSFTKFRNNKQYMIHLKAKLHKENQKISVDRRKHKSRDKLYTSSKSYLQKSILRFNKANNYAFDMQPKNYHKAVILRNRYLGKHYGMQVRYHHDSHTHKVIPQFTMADFKSTKSNNHNNKGSHSRWYDFYCLRVLAWKSKKEERCERMAKQFDFSQVDRKPVSYDQYQQIINNAIKRLPPLSHLNSDQKRKANMIVLKLPKQPKKLSKTNSQMSPKELSIKDFDRYLKQSQFQSKLLRNPHTLDGISSDLHVDGLNKDIVHVQHQRERNNEVQRDRSLQNQQKSKSYSKEITKLKQARKRGLQR